jgi:hypothetical protein
LFSLRQHSLSALDSKSAILLRPRRAVPDFGLSFGFGAPRGLRSVLSTSCALVRSGSVKCEYFEFFVCGLLQVEVDITLKSSDKKI